MLLHCVYLNASLSLHKSLVIKVPVFRFTFTSLTARGCGYTGAVPNFNQDGETKKVKYRQLGKNGVKVSEVSLGSWLTFGGATEDETARTCIEKAYDLGINFFDTANVYARGKSEEVVGRVLANYARDSFVLATKVYFPMGDGPNDKGLSRKHIMEQCHLSLKRLGTDYVDLYQAHRYDPTVPLEETLMAFSDLVQQGKVLYWGVSQWSAGQIAHATDIIRMSGGRLYPVASNQPYYNALGRDLEKDVMPLCGRCLLYTSPSPRDS